MRKAALILGLATLAPLPAHADIFIGVAGPMTGQNAVFGAQMKAGVAAAIETANAAGGINGERLVMVEGDDACDTRRALGVAADLLRQDVRVVIGHFCSGATIAVAKTYEQAGVLLISPSSTAPAVTDGGGWNVLRVASRDDAQADLAAKRMAADNANAKIAIIHDSQFLGRGLAERLKRLSPSADEIVIKAGAIDLAAVLKQIKNDGITSIYFTTAATDAGGIAAAINRAGLAVRYYGPDTLLSDVYWERAKAGGENTLVTFATDPATLARPDRLQDVFLSKAIAVDGATLTTFAAVESFVAAARNRDISNGRAMADWLKAGNAVDSIIGTIRFDAKGDVSPQRFMWYRWSDGQYQLDPQQN